MAKQFGRLSWEANQEFMSPYIMGSLGKIPIMGSRGKMVHIMGTWGKWMGPEWPKSSV